MPKRTYDVLIQLAYRRLIHSHGFYRHPQLLHLPFLGFMALCFASAICFYTASLSGPLNETRQRAEGISTHPTGHYHLTGTKTMVP